MKVLVDTSVWSMTYRRKGADSREAEVLGALIGEERAVMLGSVRQELLTGLREPAQFNRLVRVLAGFEDLLPKPVCYIAAAQISNRCRRNGIATSPVDCLLAAVAIEEGFELFTTDRDFAHIAEIVPLRLFS